jgi:hypothetical protein
MSNWIWMHMKEECENGDLACLVSNPRNVRLCISPPLVAPRGTVELQLRIDGFSYHLLASTSFTEGKTTREDLEQWADAMLHPSLIEKATGFYKRTLEGGLDNSARHEILTFFGQ